MSKDSGDVKAAGNSSVHSKYLDGNAISPHQTEMGVATDISSRNSNRGANDNVVMNRNFSIWSLGAASFSITCTWIGTGASLGAGLTQSSAAALWSIPVAGIMTLVLSLGMAELASAYPVVGAQYIWSFMLAADKYKPIASFFNGFLSIIGWWLAAGSVANFVSWLVMAIATGCYPDFSAERWQQYLLYVCLLWFAAAINVFGIRWLPLFNKMVFVASVCTLSATSITLFVSGRSNHASPSFMFATTDNGQSGWPSSHFSFLLATVNAVFGFLGTDSGAYLSEEISNPGRTVPKVMVYPVVVGLLTTFPFLCSLLYAIHDLPTVLSTPTGVPLMEIYLQATGSKAAAVVLTSVFTFCMFGCLVGVVTLSSRIQWAMSRDGALPLSHLWGRLNTHFKMPANSAVLSVTFVSLYGLIFLGSTNAFSAMVSATVMFLQTSCAMPQAILLFRGRSHLPERSFKLGTFGWAVNAAAVAWVLLVDVLACFPTILPVTAASMNYMSVVSMGLVSMVLLFWFTMKRGDFKGPRVDFELMEKRRLLALHGTE